MRSSAGPITGGAMATGVVVTAVGAPLEHAAASTPAARTTAAYLIPDAETLRTCLQLRHDGVGDLARADGRGVVPLLLQVVRDALARRDHVGDRALQRVRRGGLLQVAQHQHPRQ